MIEFLAMRLDTVNQCLWRRTDGSNDERILLPPRPFALLRYLVEHAGRLVTEDEILTAVWPNVYVQPESIKAQLHEIRKVLGDDPKSPRYIQTRPRRGYQFIAPVRTWHTPNVNAGSRPMHGHLVGRERTLLELRDHLRAASSGQRQVVFVTGEPGIGKTAVVDALQIQAVIEMPSLRIARGQCIEGYGGTEAYYPILEALGQLCLGSGAASIIEILAAQAPTWLVQFPALLTQQHREILRQEILGATRERMLREIGAALDAITAETPLLLVFEDLQWVDHATVDFISALARRRTPARLMLIATERPVDVEPMTSLKRNLLIHRLCREIALPPLTKAEVAAFLAADAPEASLADGLAEFVHRHSDGNPLFMVAILDHLSQRGLISKKDGMWVPETPLAQIAIEVPERLRHLIEAQIERLSTEEQKALEAASVAGAVFSANVAAAAIQADPDAIEEIYEALARRQRVVRAAEARQVPGGGIYQQHEFVHALYREVFYRRQPPVPRSKRHRLVGERLEALYSQQLSDVAPQLAHHFEEGADWERAARYLQMASGAARRRYARREAMAMLQRALELAGKLPAVRSAAIENALLEDLATTTAASFETLDRAVESYQTLAARARQHGLVAAEVNVLIGMCYPLDWIDSKRCGEVAERVLELGAVQSDPLLRARARACGLYFRLWTGGWDDGKFQQFERALAELRQAAASDRGVLAVDLLGYSLLQALSSRYRDAYRSATEGMTLAREAGDQNPYFNMAYQRATMFLPRILLFAGEWGNALQQVRTDIAVMHKNEDLPRAESLRIHDAWVRLHAMDFDAVRETCRTALRLFGDSRQNIYTRFALIVAGQAETGAGNYELAREYLSAARDRIDQGAKNAWILHNQLEHGLTDLWLAQGDLTQARPQAERFLEVAQARPEHTYQARAWEANARVALADGSLDRARDCIDHALSAMVGFEVPLAAWQVHATAAEVCRRAGNEQSARRHQERSRKTILMLADSLPAEEQALRQTFLSAAPIATILGMSQNFAPTVTP